MFNSYDWRNEDGSANTFAFIVILPLLLAGLAFIFNLNTAKTARIGFDDALVATAKAAASQTYTTTDGALRINLDAAVDAAMDNYLLFRPFIRDSYNSRLMDLSHTPQVTVLCKPDPDPMGEGCVGVDVLITDDYDGPVFTAGMFPTIPLSGQSSADLVITER